MILTIAYQGGIGWLFAGQPAVGNSQPISPPGTAFFVNKVRS
jgi:hypothetical protein